MPQKFDSNASLFSKPVLSDMNTTRRVWLLGTEMCQSELARAGSVNCTLDLEALRWKKRMEYVSLTI